MPHLYDLARDENGAVTVDFVGLTAAVLLLGMVLIWGVYNNGVSPVQANINDTLIDTSVNVSVGTVPDLNPNN